MLPGPGSAGNVPAAGPVPGGGPFRIVPGIHSTRAGDRRPQETTGPVKTLYRVSRVRTLSRPAEGEWILVDGRHVERVGIGEPPGADRTVELPGTVVLPGFIDAHVHLTGTTLSMIGIPSERARSAEELLGIVAEEVSHGPTKVLAHGFDE